MRVAGLCHICGRPAMHSCAVCGLTTCRDCLEMDGTCKSCSGGRKL